MLRNPNYVYGKGSTLLPSHLNFSRFILDHLWQFKEKIALINGATHEVLTYGGLVQQAMNFAVSLARMGVRKGHVIGILSENTQEYFSAVLGATCTGAVVTTFSPGYTKGELVHAMDISKPSYVICSPEALKKHENALKSLKYIEAVILLGKDRQTNVLSYNDLAINVDNIDYDTFDPVDVVGQTDTLFIIYSSGTTGLRKGVMLTHLNVIMCCSLPRSYDPSIRTMSVSPWYHAYGLVGSFTGLVSGRTGVYLPKFEVGLYLRTIEKYQIGILTVVPPVLVAVCKSTIKCDLTTVKLIVSGAAPLHKETITAVYEKFPNVQTLIQGYGSSECTLIVSKFNADDLSLVKRKIGSVGRIIEGCTLKVVDIESRKPLGPHQHGEICVKGPFLMKGYVGIQNPEDYDHEGFYKTGDVGYYDEDGYLYISDRLKELIKYKGNQVPPAEIEAVLLSHPGVKDVGVIGIPQLTEEVPLAFVVRQPGGGVTEGELVQFVAERLSNPKHLRGGVRFVNNIPKIPSGKILRRALREMAKTPQSKL